MKKIFSGLLIFCSLQVLGQQYGFPFQNPQLPLEQRIDDLISRLTLEEKSKLMLYDSPEIKRLNIKSYNWWNECLHGVARAGKATVFPQAIGLAAAFDDSLLYAVGIAVSDEARIKHYAAVRKGESTQYSGLSFWTPNINIFRDPRWGRGQETYGEDPYLTGRLGSEFVKGLQGDDSLFLKVSACAKHFAVHSGPEILRHRFDAEPPETDFRDTYLPAFKMLVDAGVESIMCAYNRTYDKPCCSSSFLLDTILRKEWKFDGHIVSDCWALDDIWARHKVTGDKVKAAAMAADAGVDLNCGYLFKYLPEAVRKGYISEKTIDKNLRYLLKTRFRLGLFDPDEKTPWSHLPDTLVDGKIHRKLAYKAASESVVLLKNNGVLPLKSPRSVFVTGELAADIGALTGNYNGFSGDMVTLLEGVVNKIDVGTKLDYTKGYVLSQDSLFNGFWQAGMSDVTIACVGLNNLLEGENGDALLNTGGGDRNAIELPQNQLLFLEKLRNAVSKNKNSKLIVVVFGGSAIALQEVENLADAVLFVWYPGEEGGNAVADIIFGNTNPSGKLPVTFYNSTSDLPPFDDYSMKGRTYKFFNGKPLHSFGYGLSYTVFNISGLRLKNKKIFPGDSLCFTLKVSNTGDFDGSEVVQIYVSEKQRDENTPIKSLVDFKRIFVKKGEIKTLNFKIPLSRLQKWDTQNKEYRVFRGKYIVEAGNSSDNIFEQKEFVVK